MNMKKLYLLIPLLIFPATALAAGIQASPEKLEFEISGAKAISKDITVSNPARDVQLFEVYADDFDRAIKANPASFTLEAGGKRKVSITVDPNYLSGGVFSTNLSVLGKPLAQSKVQVNAGVKIPVSVTITDSGHWNIIRFVLFGLIIVTVAGAGFWFWKRGL